jgi:hypothetical protein
VILAWMAVATAFVVLANLAADVLYAVLDPRIRLAGPYRRRRLRPLPPPTGSALGGDRA